MKNAYLFLGLITVALTSFASADQSYCLTGGRKLSLAKVSMDVTTEVDGKSITTPIVAEKALGTEGKANYFNLLGFYTLDEMKKKYCGGNITGNFVVYWPDYENVIGQNGFYWYLRTNGTDKITHLLLWGGRTNKDGHCEELLEGQPRYFVTCD